MFVFQQSVFKSIQVSSSRQQELVLENALEHKSTYASPVLMRHGLKNVDVTPSMLEKHETFATKDFAYSITGFKGRDFDKFDKVAKDVVATVQMELDMVYGKGNAKARIKKDEDGGNWKWYPYNRELTFTVECELPLPKEETKQAKPLGFMKERDEKRIPSWKKA